VQCIKGYGNDMLYKLSFFTTLQYQMTCLSVATDIHFCVRSHSILVAELYEAWCPILLLCQITLCSSVTVWRLLTVDGCTCYIQNIFAKSDLPKTFCC